MSGNEHRIYRIVRTDSAEERRTQPLTKEEADGLLEWAAKAAPEWNLRVEKAASSPVPLGRDAA